MSTDLRQIVDQLGRTITVSSKPNRIVSLVPSQTELLYALGLDEEVIGITKFCIHPEEWFESKTRVGGTKNFKVDLIRSLNPDLIIANKEENDKAFLEELMFTHPVWVSDISTLEEAFEMITSIGSIVDKAEASVKLVDEIKINFKKLEQVANNSFAKGKIVSYLIWNDPIMTIGHNTFIKSMIDTMGLKTIPSTQERYPTVTLEELKNSSPDFLFLSSEPFPFNIKHQNYYANELPNTKIILVDGERFSWYGSRLLYSADYFIDIIDSL
jgi:ABC-type Fe3+-hydroxamate transport system substrate-binding protein